MVVVVKSFPMALRSGIRGGVYQDDSRNIGKRERAHRALINTK